MGGLPIVLDLKSEEWRQRHFITKDPTGLLVEVIQHVPPSEEYARNTPMSEGNSGIIHTDHA